MLYNLLWQQVSTSFGQIQNNNIKLIKILYLIELDIISNSTLKLKRCSKIPYFILW